MIELVDARTALLLAFGLLVLSLAIRSLRAMRLKERYTLLFLGVGMPFLALAVWPDAVVFLANWLKIEKPTLMIFCLGAFTILMLLKLLSIISVQDRKIQTLTQMVAILAQKHQTTPPGTPSRAANPLPHLQPTTQHKQRHNLHTQLRKLQALDPDAALEPHHENHESDAEPEPQLTTTTTATTTTAPPSPTTLGR